MKTCGRLMVWLPTVVEKKKRTPHCFISPDFSTGHTPSRSFKGDKQDVDTQRASRNHQSRIEDISWKPINLSWVVCLGAWQREEGNKKVPLVRNL